MSEANEAAEKLEQLHRFIGVCVQCPLHATRTRAVPGEGPPDADVMLVGEGPGAQEDRLGRPFVGPAGEALDEVLQQAGLQRAELYITSTVKCRPPENRNPKAEEYETCCGLWLDRQIELIAPRLIVLSGKVAMLAVIGERGKLSDLHGREREQCGRRFLLTYHPAAAMRFPDAREALREDLARVSDILARSDEGGAR